MNRTIKNTIMIVFAVLLIGAICLTSTLYKSNSNNISPNMVQNGEGFGNGTPPELPDGATPDMNQSSDVDSESGKKSSKMSRGDRGTPPEKPSGEMGNPPEKPDGEGVQKPEGENGNMTEGEQPEMPNEEMGTPPEMPSDGGFTPPSMNQEGNNNTVLYVLFGIEWFLLFLIILYLIFSKMNKLSFSEVFSSKKKITLFVILEIIGTGLLTLGTSFITHTIYDSNKKIDSIQTNSNIEYSSATEISSNKKISDENYKSEEADQNSLLINNGAEVSLDSIKVSKTGDSDGGDSTSFYGTNSAILAKDGAVVTIKNATITTDAEGANGVFSYGGSATTNNSKSDGTTVTISDSTIITSKGNSGGIMTTGGGTTIAKNLTISTAGRSSAAIRSDRGGGTVSVDGGTYTSSGLGSPAIYSTADITVKNAKLVSEISEGAIIEGKNSITLDNVELISTNTENVKSSVYKNIFIYQSMSGDADEGEATFTCKNSTITTNNGESIYVTNTKALINLENNTFVNSKGNFLVIQKDAWGKEGSNGGDVTLNLKNQTITGNILVDEISTLSMSLTSSNYTGSINNNQTAKEITLSLDKNSTITLTGDSYITSFTNKVKDNSNINFNGYHLYVNGESIN